MESFYPDWLHDTLQIRVLSARVETVGVSWNYDFPRIGHWRFYWHEGEGAWLDFPDGPLRLEAVRAFIIPAGLTFRTRATNEVEQFYAHFEVVGLPEAALRRLFVRPVALPHAPALEGAARWLRAELQHESVRPALHWRVKALLYEAMARYLDTLPPEGVEKCWAAARALEPLLPALRFIEENLPRTLRNSELAARCRLSEDGFIRSFRDRMGVTPARYITERRVQAAERRLLLSSQSLDEIASATGFCSRSHLTRHFTHLKGTSPARFRQSATSSGDGAST